MINFYTQSLNTETETTIEYWTQTYLNAGSEHTCRQVRQSFAEQSASFSSITTCLYINSLVTCMRKNACVCAQYQDAPLQWVLCVLVCQKLLVDTCAGIKT